MKNKIVNDPVYGFITIPAGIIAKIIDSPFVQRLNRIRQLGLSYLVYPGATHTRFGHTLGTIHLLQQAMHILEHKKVDISPEEKEATLLAILLHDTGHAPFSHALEKQFFTHHESISLAIMQQLRSEYGELIDFSIAIFTNHYEQKPFLHQLISSQLDVDRLDYLTRDSFFTGVSEGVIGTERIIHMLCLADNDLAVEEKGIYSIEKFIVARRLMYWQVYYHKTVVTAEIMINSIFDRAKEILMSGKTLFASPSLLYFLKQPEPSVLNDVFLSHFINVDDSDVLSAVKVWQYDEDPILSYLAKSLMQRKLFRTVFYQNPIPLDLVEKSKQHIKTYFEVSEKETSYFMSHGMIENNAYNALKDKIWIRMNNGNRYDISEVSEQMSQFIKEYKSVKYYLTLPKEIWEKIDYERMR
jgi:HD superfamily phosphohydrolase